MEAKSTLQMDACHEAQLNYYQAKLAYEIDAWDLQQAMAEQDSIIILDVRSSEAFNHEHIASAANFHHKTMNEKSVRRLDPAFTYVCYCDGIGCNASTKGALKLAQSGFKVKELIGGLEWWKRDGYATEGMLGKQDICCNCD